MSIKSIVKLNQEWKTRKRGLAPSQEEIEQSSSFMDEFTQNAEIAKEAILSRISESEFAQYMEMAERASITAMFVCGETGGLKLKATGVLKDYTHSVVLAIIGGLIRDEVL